MSLVIPTTAELQSYQVIATVAANNPHWRKVGGGGTNEQVVATILSVMLLARELSISPIQAISGGINNIQGKFEISARLMNQLIRKHGHLMQVKESTNEVCIIRTKRKDTGEEHTETYHIEEAALAGLIKETGGWKKCPKDMLFARCISRLARRVYPDCIGGCYVEGELQETIQGKSIDSVEIPPAKELDAAVEIPPEIEIMDLLDGYDPIRVNQFIKDTADASKTSVAKVKERAVNNMKTFLEVFRQWEAQHFPLPTENMDDVVA